MNAPTLLDEKLPPMQLGEGIVWDHKAHQLYWVDIEGSGLHIYHLATTIHTHHKLSDRVTFILPGRSGNLVIGLGRTLCRINPVSGQSRLIAAPSMPKSARFNDAATDPWGRLWAGTMSLADPPKPIGILYCRDQGQLKIQDKNFKIVNGMDWSPDKSLLYLSDTAENKIWHYDFDVSKGLIHNRRLFVKNEGPGKPDGLCVDSLGYVYSAQWEGSCINVYAPDGHLDEIIPLPVPHVTSCCFGGADLRTLYITTAREGLNAKQLRSTPLAGHVFACPRIRPGLSLPLVEDD